MAFWNRRAACDKYVPQAQAEIDDRDEILAAERAKAGEARRAVASATEAVAVETARLRDSRVIAAELREHVRTNGFTERIAASFALREKGI